MWFLAALKIGLKRKKCRWMSTCLFLKREVAADNRTSWILLWLKYHCDLCIHYVFQKALFFSSCPGLAQSILSYCWQCDFFKSYRQFISRLSQWNFANQFNQWRKVFSLSFHYSPGCIDNSNQAFCSKWFRQTFPTSLSSPRIKYKQNVPVITKVRFLETASDYNILHYIKL